MKPPPTLLLPLFDLLRPDPRAAPQVHLKVEMACSGCSGAVERVLKKMEGVSGESVVAGDRLWARQSALHG